jgi:hypothetical protein
MSGKLIGKEDADDFVVFKGNFFHERLSSCLNFNFCTFSKLMHQQVFLRLNEYVKG